MNEKILAVVISGIYGVFGSIAHYFWEVMQKEEVNFNPAFFLINGFLGFFIGVVIGDFIPQDMTGRDGIILICGFLVYQVLQLLEDGGLAILLKKLGINKKNEK